jgi:hypothetical protein
MPIMDEDNTHPDRLLSEPQELSTKQRERSASMSQGQLGNVEVRGEGNEMGPLGQLGSPTGQMDANAKAVEEVVNSEVWILGGDEDGEESALGVVPFGIVLIVCGRLVFLRC